MNPPGPRKSKQSNGCRNGTKHQAEHMENGQPEKRVRLNSTQKCTKMKPVKLKAIIRNEIQSKICEIDDTSLQLTSNQISSHDNITQNDDEMEDNSNVIISTPNGSPSIKQKVKYIPQNQFVHIKPPPINTQKLYVKQQNGNRSYTLGVKNIGTTDVPVMKNQLIDVKNNEIVSPIKITKRISPTKSTSIKNIEDIFDIPILFADHDGNIIDENQIHCETRKTVKTPNPNKSINIISNEIIKNAMIGKNVVGIC